MKKGSKLLILFFVATLIFSCSSSKNEECTKSINVPTWNGATMTIENQRQIVPCDFDELSINEPVNGVPTELQNFSYEVLGFEFTPDTGNNTSRLRFEIILNNNNNFLAKGFPILNTIVDGTSTSANYSSDASISCSEILANSSCVFTLDKEYSLDTGIVNSITLDSVSYFIIN